MSNNIEQVLRGKFQKVRKTKGKNGLEFRVCCPFCPEPDRKFKLYINPGRQQFNCYRCHKGGTLRGLLGELYSPSFAAQRIEVREKEEPLPDNVRPPGYSVPINTLDSVHPVIEYLTKTRKRPFDANELYNTFGVRYCTQGTVFKTDDFHFNTSNTIIFPVWMFGKVIGWQSRLMYEPDKMNDDQCSALGFPKDEDGDWMRPPKYLTSPGFRKGRVLYNFDLARKFPYVVVTEGTFDCMSVGPAAVATFGTGISEQQCRLLKTYWQTVIIMLDPEGTDEVAEEVHNELCRAVNVVRVKLVGYKDPGDAPRAVIWEQISAATQHLRLNEKALIEEGLRARRPAPLAPEPGRNLWRIIKD